MPAPLPEPKYLDRNTPPHITTLVLIAGLSAASLTIFLASLPEMARYFDVPYALMQFAITGYLALTAIAQILIGPISDRYGRRPVLLISIVIFIVASFCAAFSPNFESLLAFRALQAAIVSGMVLSRTIVRDNTIPLTIAACKARKAKRLSKLGENAAQKLATMKITIEISKTGLRPYLSEIGPIKIWAIAVRAK
jgi:MFS family permease